MADETPKILVDTRMPNALPTPDKPPDSWEVRELFIDPTWHGGVIEIGGQMIPVLGFSDPRGHWTHYSLSPTSLEALRKWIEELPKDV